MLDKSRTDLFEQSRQTFHVRYRKKLLATCSWSCQSWSRKLTKVRERRKSFARSAWRKAVRAVCSQANCKLTAAYRHEVVWTQLVAAWACVERRREGNNRWACRVSSSARQVHNSAHRCARRSSFGRAYGQSGFQHWLANLQHSMGTENQIGKLKHVPP